MTGRHEAAKSTEWGLVRQPKAAKSSHEAAKKQPNPLFWVFKSSHQKQPNSEYKGYRVFKSSHQKQPNSEYKSYRVQEAAMPFLFVLVNWPFLRVGGGDGGDKDAIWLLQF